MDTKLPPQARRRTKRTERWCLRVVATALAAAAASSVAVVSTSSNATAASSIEYCFVYEAWGGDLSNNRPFDHETKLQVWFNNRWTPIATFQPNQHGCVAVDIPYGTLRNYHLRGAVSWQKYGLTCTGTTPFYASPGHHRYHVGTGIVYCRKT